MTGARDDMTQPAAIADYALLSDCHAPALVSRDGSVDWWCPPRADQASVLGRLLDPAAGHWQLSAVDPIQITRRYLDDTMVLETTVTTDTGQVRILDCLSLEPGARGHDIGLRAPRLLVRSVEGIGGSVAMRCELAPRLEYGLTRPHLRSERGAVIAEGGALRLRLTSPIGLIVEERAAIGEFAVEAEQRLTFGLAYSPLHGEDAGSEIEPDEAVADTVEGWRSWVDAHTRYEGLHAEAVRRGALVLQALTYQPSGAILAAPTTSLPARLGGRENWDYRYAWLRDLSLTAQALWVGACPDEVGRFLRFIADAAGEPAEGDRVQIMYGLDGRRWLPEHQLAHLRGYGGSRPVRVGNAAWDQSQLDVRG